MTNLPPNTEIFYTADGSPTLSYAREDGYREKMHHSGGALSESLYIYHHALLEGLRLSSSPQVLSVGLGLGYNEMITVAEMAKSGVEDYKIWSFETVPALRDGFREQSGIFVEVARAVAGHFGISELELRALTQNALKSNRLQLRGAFPDEAGDAQANVVFYDAYSRKMNETLWDENQLERTLKPIVLAHCVFATYACVGGLNRSLRRLGFRRINKTGFQGKRESTLAILEQSR